MNRFSARTMWAVAAVLVVVVCESASAQPEEGRRGRGGRGGGGFGVTAVRLAAESDEVQAALKLTDEQKKQAADINDQLRDDIGAVLQSGQGFDKIQTLYQDASAKLGDALDDEQEKRLAGVAVQINGAGAVMEPTVAKELSITDEQNKQLAEVRESNRQAMRELFGQGLSRDEMRDKFGELRDEANKKLLAALTPEQQEKLESLKGEPVDVDMSQFRGPGQRGGSEGRGRDRDRDRQRGDQDRDSAEEKEAAKAN